MKWIKLLIIVISLSLPIHSYACWDDDMDDDDEGWYNNNDDDDDYAWDIDLPDVIITPDDDDSWDESDDDWWRTDYGDDDDSWDDSSDDDDDWWDDDDDIPNVGNSENNFYFSAMKPLGTHSPSENEIDINRKSFITLPASWPSQNTKMGCVSTVLEYVSNYLYGSLTYDSYLSERTCFEDQYIALFNSDLTIDGVLIEIWKSFLPNVDLMLNMFIFHMRLWGIYQRGILLLLLQKIIQMGVRLMKFLLLVILVIQEIFKQSIHPMDLMKLVSLMNFI